MNKISRLQVKDFLTEKEMAAIGSVVAESAHLENVLEAFIIQMTKLSQAQYDILIGAKMMGAKIAIVKDLGLLKLKSEKRRKAFTKVMDSLARLNADRVGVVHGLWRPEGGVTFELVDGAMTGRITRDQVPPGIAYHKKGKKWFKMEAKDLDGLAQDLTDTISELIKVWDPRYFRQMEKEILERALERARRLKRNEHH
jgi:hypothetical protein